MARGKLILICQSGGEFVTNNDGSLSYTGGEAHAVDIYRETLFDDLKLKFAEMWNLEYKSMIIKYFLPGNRRTLITLSGNKDLKRMIDFHGDSVTADVFVMGKEGFDHNTLAVHASSSRSSGIKLAENVKHAAAFVPAAAACQAAVIPPVGLNYMPASTVIPVTSTAIDTTVVHANGTPTAVFATATVTPAFHFTISVSAPADTSIAVDATSQSPSTVAITSKSSHDCNITDNSHAAVQTPAESVSVAADTTAQSPTRIDVTSTPADTVKKRRRTASWQIGANGPTIVAVTDDMVEKKKTAPRKRNSRRHSAFAAVDDVDLQLCIDPFKDDFKDPHAVANSNDVSLENLVASWKDGITGVGQEFKSVHEFRDALQKYAIAHRFVYRLKKNDTNRASGKCIVDGCSWRIHASWVPAAQSFKIKKMNKSHTCGGESWKSAHPTKNWLVSIIKKRLQDTPHQKPKEIANGIFRDFGIELNYTQVWRGIEDAREQLQGSYKEAYNQLPWLCKKVMETNPGTVAKLLTSDENRFQSLFLSFHASIHGFLKGCRPLLFLDATSLRSKHQEILFSATAVDGNDGLFPVAFAIVDVENNDNWHWFLEQLKFALSTSQSITFVSDREKGLKNFVLEIFKNAHYGYSLYHLMEKFKKNLRGPFHGDGKGSLPVNFVAAAQAVRLDNFKKFIEEIKRVSSTAYDWVMHIEPEYWTNALFKGENYCQITANTAESYSKLIEKMRELPIMQKIDALICMVMELINTCRTDSSKWPAKLTPSKEEELQEEIQKACSLKVLFSSDTLFEVHDNSINVVNIENWECSCLAWKATGLPCCHAIAVFNCTDRSVYDYCSRFFTVDSFRVTYAESINPLPSMAEHVNRNASSDSMHVLPPCTSRPPRQQKRKQVIKTRAVVKRVVSCTRCKEAGHNKATCKAILD
ncbi:uncharacterized protein LOC131158175 [Malania oleifera]|uniref:uncharacterized protein LOC131158175 n=1 Tax=Malania oleifera TaxID=397392 RepID=UPI0025AE1E43|nr:uncharacterized protein LOC131158175 [Malania oleifera]XP_057968830.1 uncharacterized protein LOC131158175 [Malania oleifera]XP_057968831.1 uncharacterized protein LOC131158175 [Malania oleifera]